MPVRFVRVFTEPELKYVNEYGLINASKNKYGVDENCILYSYQYYLLTGCSNIKENMEEYISSCNSKVGIYNQYPEMKGTKEDYMSHDQLTTIMNYSYKLGYDWHKHIWKEILRQKFRYDNVNPENPSWSRFLHPRDIIYYAYLNKHWIGYCEFLTLAAITIQSMLSTTKVRPTLVDRIKTRLSTGSWPEKRTMFKTDGQLLIFTKIHSCERFLFRILKKVVDKILKKKYSGWAKIFGIYFPEGHPNANKSKGI